MLQSIVRSINQLLLRAKEEHELYQGVCDYLIKFEPVRFTWIGLVQPDTPEIKPGAWAGYEEGYLSKIKVVIDDSELSKEPIGRAIKTGEPFIIGNIATNPAYIPWRDEARSRGYASVIALPLKHQGDIIGCLTVYSGSKYAFAEEEISFLVEVANDIAVGVKSIRLEKQLEQSLKTLEKTMYGTITAIARLSEVRDPYTSGHSYHVAELSRAIAQRLGLSENRWQGIYLAGLIHDIGKIAVPSDILNKPGKLSEHEFNIIKTHPQVAYDILKGLEFPWPLAETILQHHERLDGSGYPHGLKAPEICLEAKILSVADVVEAIHHIDRIDPH